MDPVLAIPCEKCGLPRDLRTFIEKNMIEIRKCAFTGRDLVDLKDVAKAMTRAAEHKTRREKEDCYWSA